MGFVDARVKDGDPHVDAIIDAIDVSHRIELGVDPVDPGWEGLGNRMNLPVGLDEPHPRVAQKRSRRRGRQRGGKSVQRVVVHVPRTRSNGGRHILRIAEVEDHDVDAVRRAPQLEGGLHVRVVDRVGGIPALRQ